VANQKISLKAARVNAGYTQEKASADSNISIDRIKRVENEPGAKLTIAEICKLCEIYGIELSNIKIKEGGKYGI